MTNKPTRTSKDGAYRNSSEHSELIRLWIEANAGIIRCGQFVSVSQIYRCFGCCITLDLSWWLLQSDPVDLNILNMLGKTLPLKFPKFRQLCTDVVCFKNYRCKLVCSPPSSKSHHQDSSVDDIFRSGDPKKNLHSLLLMAWGKHPKV